MPAKSKAQANLMRAAEHGATFPLAQKVRAGMSLGSLHDFAATKSKSLPAHVSTHHPAKNLGAYHHPPKRRG